MNDADTFGHPEQIENNLKIIPSLYNVNKFLKDNNIDTKIGMEIEVKERPISPLTPVKLGENQDIITEIEPPILNCNGKRPRSSLKGGKRKTRKVLKRISKVLKWRDLDPPKKTLKSFKKKHGNKCFLRPKELKYPICDKYKGKVNCKGLLAAHNRAMLSVRRGLKPKKYSYKKLAKTARKVAKKHKCNWVLKKSKKSKK